MALPGVRGHCYIIELWRLLHWSFTLYWPTTRSRKFCFEFLPAGDTDKTLVLDLSATFLESFCRDHSRTAISKSLLIFMNVYIIGRPVRLVANENTFLGCSWRTSIMCLLNIHFTREESLTYVKKLVQKKKKIGAWFYEKIK